MLARRKKKPRTIELLNAEGMLQISWNDSSQSRYDLEALRSSCPCALCREARDTPTDTQDGLNMLTVSEEAVSATGKANSFAEVGRYGIRIEWADGTSWHTYA
jgi:DUF971 family protein